MELELDQDEESKCSKCLSGCRKVTTFLLSHVGLISLVVGYCIMGAFTFTKLESSHEIQVKRNITKVRHAVTEYLWVMTKNTHLIREDVWLQNATHRLQEFETELMRAMKKGGWDGSESELTQQWTFSGALFYSIVVITTIGYGHQTPKTLWGKMVTILYAILGIPLMLLCLSHIGDFMAKAFRFLYWKVCCYMCTRKPRPMRRYQGGGTFRRGRSLRSNPTRPGGGSTRGMKRSASAMRPRSARISQRSADSDSAIFSYPDHGIRRVHSDDHLRAAVPMQRMNSPPRHLRPETKIIQRSTRSAEPAFGSRRNLSILTNKYAEEVITNEDQIMRRSSPPVHYRVRQLRSPERFAYGDYWDDEEADEYIYGSDDDDNIRKKPVPIWLCVLLVLSYIIFGAFLFSNWEGWKFLDSAYFCFVTLTTIGFGDFVPVVKNGVKNDSSEVSIALCSLYLLFGISLLAMSFNLVQEQVISGVKLVATRLGIIQEEED